MEFSTPDLKCVLAISTGGLAISAGVSAISAGVSAISDHFLKKIWNMKGVQSNFIFDIISPRPWKSEQLTTEKPQYQELLLPVFKLKSQEFEEWVNAPYTTNPVNRDQLIHDTPTPIKVRSKSEALIAMVLYNHKIPWRYECALQLGAVTYYPDYTILHPKTGAIIYCEHWGMIDNPTYSQQAFQKMQVYSNLRIRKKGENSPS